MIFKSIKRRIAFLLLISSLGFNYSLIASSDSGKLIVKDNFIENELDKDYLKKYPTNSYLLGPGDTIRIVVSTDYPELTRISTIDGEGSIYLPLLKRVYVEGLTLEELNNLLNQSFKEYVRFPEVETYIKSYRPIKIFVNGEVNQPGLYTLKGSQTPGVIDNLKFNENSLSVFDNNLGGGAPEDLRKNFLEVNPLQNLNEVSFYFPTVFDALRTSGGVTQYSDLSAIVVKRRNSISNGGGRIIASINMRDAIINGDESQNIRIYDGDVIEVSKLKSPSKNLLSYAIKTNLNSKFIRVLVSGRVNNPGKQILTKSSTLNDAIDVAGGTKVVRGPIRFISFNGDGSIEKRIIAYRRRNKSGSYHNPILKDGDLVIVGNSLLSNTTEFITEVTAPFVGLYSTYSFFDMVFED